MNVREINPNNPKDPKALGKMFDDAKSKVKNPIAHEAKDRSYLSADSTITVTKDVPSKMLPYPTGSGISYRPFTYGELLKFNSSTLSETDKIKFILDGIITTEFDKSNLAYADFLFIALLRKISAFSDSKFNYSFICDECGKENNNLGNLNEIEFKDLEIPSLPLVIDVDENTTLELNPMTVGAFIKLRNAESTDSLVAYAECVINMSSDEAFKIINNAHGDLIYVLEEADRMVGFGNQTLDCKCSKCDALNIIPLGGIQDLIQPFREPTESIKARIRFSK